MENVLTDKKYQKRNCCINIIYKLPEQKIIEGMSVYDMRFQLGMLMADKMSYISEHKIDYICPVPNTGIPYARGLASKSGYECREIIKKVSDIRSFHIENTDERRELLKRIVQAGGDKLQGKNICLVDEAIFTGTTLKIVCELLREKGTKHIYIIIPTPPCRYECKYGSIPVKQMLLRDRTEAEAAELIGADKIIFQSNEVFKAVINKTGMSCAECFKD